MAVMSENDSAQALGKLNGMTSDEFQRTMYNVCHSETFVSMMSASRPFCAASAETLSRQADKAWDAVPRAERLQAFAAHPRIGQPSFSPERSRVITDSTEKISQSRSFDKLKMDATGRLTAERPYCKQTGKENNSHESDAAKHSESKFLNWSKIEQSGVNDAVAEIKSRLASANECYFAKFQYIFIVCAAGKTAEELLALLEARVSNDPETEFSIASEEQRKIIQARLQKLLQEVNV